MVEVVYYFRKKEVVNLVCLVKGHSICKISCKEESCDDEYKGHCPRCGTLFIGIIGAAPDDMVPAMITENA